MSERLRVLIDGRALTDHSSYRGIGRYLTGLLSGLSTRDDLDVTVLATDDATLPNGLTRRRMRRRLDNRFANLEHELRLPLDIGRVPRDVFHSPAQDPLRRSRQPWVHTLHGLSPFALPDDGLEAERRRWATMGPRVATADMVIAVSRFSADEAIRSLGLDHSRVAVAHHGVDAKFRVERPVPPADPPYLLFVGEHGVGKGHAEAYEVIGRLADRGAPHSLKVAGRISPWWEHAMRQTVADSRRPDRVQLLGYTKEGLPRLYREASALVVTSRYESFGLPAIEAMASGIPVVAFDNSALREVIGSGGVLVPDGDLDAMADRLWAIVTDAAYDADIRAGALRRARDFTWEASAAIHAEVYQQAAAGG